MRRLFVSLLAATFVGMPAVMSAAQSGQPKKPTLYYIPHTHWEGAVFKTREEYLEMGLPHILEALTLLRKYPNYKFTLDQVAYIRPFLERYPEHRAEFLQFVKEGRLGIVGGMDVMPDDDKPGGELFVRQMEYGKRWCRDNLGVDVTTSWMLDTFGHHPQMPQLLREAGFTSFWFCRGVPTDDLPSEFLWKGIDGTKIPAFWLPGFYGLFYGPPSDLNGFTRFFVDRYHALDKHALPSERVGLAGVDVSDPEPQAPPLVEQFNADPKRPFNIKTAIPEDFAAVAARRKNRPEFDFDLNPIFQGTYSSRIELKQETRQIEQELLTAEKLQAIAGWLGKAGSPDLMQAWEPVLFNQTHDLGSGVMTDHVYLDVLKGYDYARKFAADDTKASSEYMLSRINTLGPGSAAVVFNPSGWSRTDVAKLTLGFTTTDVYNLQVTDFHNRIVPAAIVGSQLNPNGSLLTATVIFTAPDIPALGYSVFHVMSAARAPVSNTGSANPDELENQFYTVTVDRATGAITGLFDKTLQWQALSAPANVVAEQPDKGDLWELYHGLDGAQFISMKDKQPVPNASNSTLSTDFDAKPGSVVKNPVFQEYSVTHPLGTGSFSTVIRLYNGIPRVDVSTDLINNDKLVRYQALFPTAIAQGRNTQEIPFGSVERPSGVEYPAQNWDDYSDGVHGLTLLNAGMPGNLVSDGVLMLSLLRSHTLGGYGFGGGYEPGMTSDSGYELNRKLSFHYALAPHGADWKAAATKAGFELNQPLVVFKAATHPGNLPASYGMLEISADNVIVTALKPGPDRSTIVRLYEAAGKPVHAARLRIAARVLSAHESNLMEEDGRPMAVSGGTVRFDLRPFEIKTIRLQLANGRL